MELVAESDAVPEPEGWDVILEALRQREGRVDTPDFLAGWVEGWARVHGWKIVRA